MRCFGHWKDAKKCTVPKCFIKILEKLKWLLYFSAISFRTSLIFVSTRSLRSFSLTFSLISPGRIGIEIRACEASFKLFELRSLFRDDFLLAKNLQTVEFNSKKDCITFDALWMSN